MKDVLIVYWEVTSDIARIIGDKLHGYGYTIDLVSDKDYGNAAPASVVLPVVAGDCAKGFVFGNVPVVPVWPNNCTRPEGVSVEVSTLDMVGTDFEVSLDKACERFPQELKNAKMGVRYDIKHANWASALTKCPELADICPFEKLSADEWCELLKSQPGFANKCDWTKLDGTRWTGLLCERPEFAVKCDWSKIGGGEWAKLLAERPEFSGHCEWSKIKECYDWVKLLSKRPVDEFIKRCDFSKIDGYRWVELIEAQPKFSDWCEWGKLNGKNWADLLTAHPEFSEKCDWGKLGGEAWSGLLKCRPEYAEKCVWTKLSGSHWVELLSERPEFCDHCDWRRLSIYNWMDLLDAQPRFAANCDWSRLQRADVGWWDNLLTHHPQFAERCDGGKVDCWNRTDIVKRHPVIAKSCDWSRFDGRSVVDILKDRPELSEFCDWNRLERDDWKTLLALRPQFSRFCPEQVKSALVVADHRAEADDVHDLRYDVFIASNVKGRVAARRLRDALEKRQYSVYVDERAEFSEEDREAIDVAKYFMLIRSEGLFDEIMEDGNSRARQIQYAIGKNRRMISVGPTDQKWQDSRHLPGALKSIETDQVKNLDMGDLFEEKVEALVRESMKSERGSLAKKYDVFISYRRATGDGVARRLHQRLKEMGYLVFLDYDCILNGKYDKVIRSAIDSAPVFISLLTEKSLDRCADPEDWVAAEIRMAINAKKSFVPVMPSNQVCVIPDSLPKDMDSIRQMDVVRLDMEDGFEVSVNGIVKRFPEALRQKADEIVAAINAPKNCGGDSEIWADVLRKYPESISVLPYKDFGGWDWRTILIKVPEVAYKCDWPKLCHHEIMDVVSAHPKLGDFCDFSCFEGWNWACLLREQPQFADRCEWRKFTGKDWNCLYRDNPELARQYEHLRDWSRMKSGEWRVLLEKRPEFADKCDWSKMKGSDVSKLLQNRPELVDKCDLSRLDGADWTDLLIEKPELACRCSDWWLLDGNCWAQLLKEWPIEDFEEHCDWWKLNGVNWVTILTSEKLHLFSDDSVPEKVREDLLARFRRWRNECNNRASGCDWSGVDGTGWSELLLSCPQLSVYCDWSCLEQQDWNRLLRAQGEFKDRCIACGYEVRVDYGVTMIEHRHRRLMSECDFEDAVTDLELEYVGEGEEEFKYKGKFLTWEESECDDDDDFGTMAHVKFELAFDDGWSDGYAVVHGRLSIGLSNDVLSVDDIGIRIDGGCHKVPGLERYLKDTLECLKGDSGTSGLTDWDADDGSGAHFVSMECSDEA